MDDYTDIRKSGNKLKKRAAAVMKKLDKSVRAWMRLRIESEDYKKIRDCRKSLDSLQEECDVSVRGGNKE